MEDTPRTNTDLVANPHKEAGQLSVREFVAVVFIHKWTIFVSFLILLFAILWGLSLRERVYVASVKFYINRALQQQASLRYVGLLEWEEEINSLAEMGRSQGVLTGVAREFDELRGWENPPLARMQEVAGSIATIVEVTPVPETDIINILVRDADADTALVLAELYGSNFIKEFMHISHKSHGKDFFENALIDLENKIEETNAKKVVLQSEQDLYSWEHEIGALNESVQLLERELINMQMRRGMLEKQIELESRFFDDPDNFVLTTRLRENKLIDQIEYELGRLEFELSRLSSTYTAEHRLVKAQHMQIEATKIQRFSMIEAVIVENRQRVEELFSGEIHLQQEIDRIRKRLAEIPAGAAQLEYYNSYLVSQWRLHSELIQKYNDAVASVEQSLLENEVVQLGPPNIGGLEGQTPKIVSFFVAPIFALLLSLSLAFLMEATNHSFQKPADIEDFTGLPVLASFRKI
ncbi:MAG: hypothetical protein GY835_21760 [bacterium]|nr:hypothetical protein [bacterium]